jgi:hypothetical protein
VAFCDCMDVLVYLCVVCMYVRECKRVCICVFVRRSHLFSVRWITAHHITTSSINSYRLNDFKFQDFNHYPFLTCIYVTHIILTEIVIIFN